MKTVNSIQRFSLANCERVLLGGGYDPMGEGYVNRQKRR